MKQIPLTRGLFALVDDEDYESLSKFKWCAMKGGLSWYALRRRPGKKNETFHILMHREIMGVIADRKIQVDHINHNGLDNRRANLRPCSLRQNRWNKKGHSKNTKYKGAYKNGNTWFSHIGVNNRIIYLGNFRSDIDAAKAYDEAAKKHHGEYAYLNFGGKN